MQANKSDKLLLLQKSYKVYLNAIKFNLCPPTIPDKLNLDKHHHDFPFSFQLNSSAHTIDELYDISEDLLFLTSNNVTLAGHVIASQDILRDLMSKSLTDYSDFDLVRGLVQVSVMLYA